MVLCYHGVRSGFEPGISALPAGRLERQLDYFLARGFHPIATDSNSNESTTLSVTLDDALTSQVDLWAGPLAERGLRATLFVPAGFVGRRATCDYTGRHRRHAAWTQLAEWIGQGHAIGSHGMYHRDLRNLSQHELSSEVEGSKRLLEDRLGVAVESLSYPFGRFNSRVVQVVRKAGYTHAFTARPDRTSTDCFTRPRIVVSLFDTELSIEARLQSSVWGGIERGKQRLITFWSGGTALRQIWIHRTENAAA